MLRWEGMGEARQEEEDEGIQGTAEDRLASQETGLQRLC